MVKRVILTGLLLLLMVSFVWAGDSVTISMSLTIPSIPGVNAPARIPEMLIRDYKNTTATVGEEIIEKVTAQGRTIYTR